MTKWLEAARKASGVGTKPTIPTKPAQGGVLSVKSVLSEAEKPDEQPDADGVARTDAAIEAVWAKARQRAVRYRQENKPPTCASCGQPDWMVSLTEPDGTKLHMECWKHRRAENELI